MNVREQQDALDFYQALIDQLDEQLKVCVHVSRGSPGYVLSQRG